MVKTAGRQPLPNVKAIVLEHLPSLRRYARALVGSKQAADELVQECIVRVLARRRCLDDIRNPRAYLFSILHNAYVDTSKQAGAVNGKALVDHYQFTTYCAPPQPSRIELQDLERALLQRPELFAGTVTEKLLIFALGRGIRPSDAPAVREILRHAASEQYRFSSLILGIVNSPPFLMRTTAEPPRS